MSFAAPLHACLHACGRVNLRARMRMCTKTTYIRLMCTKIKKIVCMWGFCVGLNINTCACILSHACLPALNFCFGKPPQQKEEKTEKFVETFRFLTRLQDADSIVGHVLQEL